MNANFSICTDGPVFRSGTVFVGASFVTRQPRSRSSVVYSQDCQGCGRSEYGRVTYYLDFQPGKDPQLCVVLELFFSLAQ